MEQNTVNDKHKDRLFRALFGDAKRKKNTLELYNAVNNSSYTNEDDIILTTIEDAIYLGMQNDVSFVIASTMNLYEHQSKYNPNMPVRGLMYFGKLYAKYIESHKELHPFSTKKMRLPTPKYVVFYNGKQEAEDRVELKLTDSFAYPKESCVEVTATMLNINHGRNRALMEKSKTLREYAYFIELVRENAKELTLQEAVEKAVDQCISEGVLKDYLAVHKAEVIGMLTKEYSETEIAEMFYDEGLGKGRKEGGDDLADLYNTLKSDGRNAEAERLMTDASYRSKMLAEHYGRVLEAE